VTIALLLSPSSLQQKQKEKATIALILKYVRKYWFLNYQISCRRLLRYNKTKIEGLKGRSLPSSSHSMSYFKLPPGSCIVVVLAPTTSKLWWWIERKIRWGR
jgi:hypothetical protein